MTQDIVWDSDKSTRKRDTQENQEINPFSVGDHKTARNRQDSLNYELH